MKTKFILIISALCILAIASIGYNIIQYKNKKEDNSRIGNLVESQGKNKVVETYVKDSITHIIFQDKEIKNNRAEKELAIGKSYADSLSKALKVSLDKIDQVTKYTATLEAKLALKENLTAQGKRTLSHRDKNLTMDYFPETDSVNLKMNIGLNDARYTKKSWFFGNPQRYIDVFPDDERVTINGLKSYTIKESTPKRFGIGLSAGYGFLINENGVLKPAPYIGAGLNYNLKEF